MKHRSITLTETQEKAFRLATEAHAEKVHFLWYPQSDVEMDEFIEDSDKVGMGEWLMQSWCGSVVSKRLPIWERVRKDLREPLGPACWKSVGYYDPEDGTLVIK